MERWTLDEHRLGLTPVLGRVWAKRGQRRVVRGYHRYPWLYVSCCVRPTTGDRSWLSLPKGSTELFTRAVEHVARQVGTGAGTRVLLVLDRAGDHTGKEVRLPDGMEVAFLPARSPDVHPVERLWPLTNEGIATTLFADRAELEQALGRRWVVRAEQPDLLRSSPLYHWWPQVA